MAQNKNPASRKKTSPAPRVATGSVKVRVKPRAAVKPKPSAQAKRKTSTSSKSKAGVKAKAVAASSKPKTKTTAAPRVRAAAKPSSKPALEHHLKAKSSAIAKSVRASKPVQTLRNSPKLIRKPSLSEICAIGGLLVLLASTLYWTVLSARIHQANADQIIDTYLFESVQTFQQASFPAAHSFLLKWPMFALMQLFGNTYATLMAATVIMVLITVGVIAWLFYKIEKRPAVFGLLCLALASMLLLVPAQPYSGALLPVNMAMMTTRNLEYVLYIVVLYYAVRLRSLRTRRAWPLIGLMALLIASDKLFAVLAIGAGLAAAAYVVARRQRAELRAVLRWAGVAVFAAAAAVIALWLINALGVTHVGGGQTASPYPLIHSAKQVAVGSTYAVMAFLTNFGANPVYAVTIIQNIPGAAADSLKYLSTVPYVINGLLLGFGVLSVLRLLVLKRTDSWTRLSVLLVGSTLTAAAVYILTDHYYPVDARYLTIGLFAVSVAVATYWQDRQIRLRYGLALAVLLLISLPIGALTTWHQYRSSEAALKGRNQVTNQVAEEVSRHNIKRLVGDYWDVTPVKANTVSQLMIAPVEQCTRPNQALISRQWYKPPATRLPAAYLAIKDGSPQAGPNAVAKNNTTTYGGCSLAHLVGTYGVPSERVVINPTGEKQDSPDVLLLLYPNGVKPGQGEQHAAALKVTNKLETPAVPTPKPLTPIGERTVCSLGTSLQVVAHEDDDLLFMNPDVSASIKEGRCIRTVYVTAGDAGERVNYWGGREKGAQAAYAQMFDVPNVWREEQQVLADHQVTVAYLSTVPGVSLVFLRLPDGNMHGGGFAGHKFQSLRGLIDGRISNIQSVDEIASFTRQGLVDSLREIMNKDLPDQIRTQASDNLADGDHADHHDVGRLTLEAAAAYSTEHTITRYLGYPDKDLPVNLSDDAITIKQTTFLTYAKFDGAVCQSVFECQQTLTYGSYLSRQYQPIQPVEPAAAATPSEQPI